MKDNLDPFLASLSLEGTLPKQNPLVLKQQTSSNEQEGDLTKLEAQALKNIEE